LPNDDFSIDNAIILKNSTRWPLMIDPQIQANNWIQNMEDPKTLIILRPNKSAKEMENQVESAMQLGYPILLENISDTIDTFFEPVLQKKLVKSGGSWKIKFNDKLFDYTPEFRFYMTTKLARPHYPPEVCVMVTILNFQVTLEGLDDQMLNIVVKIEEPVKDEQRQRNIKEFFENKNKQKATEDMILKLLNDSKGNLLDDTVLIDTLQNSKLEAQEISEKMEKLEYFRVQFNTIRNLYKEVSKRVSNMYFVILDLAMIEPTYQWSLEFYIALFERAIKSLTSKENRTRNIIDRFQMMLYESICRSLLEKDKLIFSLLMCMKVLQSDGKITANEVRFMMVGGTWTETDQKPPADTKWLSNKVWCSICELSKSIPLFEGLNEDFKKMTLDWAAIYNANDLFESKFPGKWNSLNSFQKLIIIRLLRPDKFSKSIQKLITKEMGAQYIDPPPFNLEQAYNDSDKMTPLIFILSPGADPRIEITNLAEQKGFKNNFTAISLGQGQG
jgi:dynein heavy chain